jgi:uncharacterized protein
MPEPLIQIANNAGHAPLQTRRRAFNVLTKPIGPICNLDCAYCYYLEKQRLFGSGERYRMTDEILDRYIGQYIDAQSGPEVQMAWQGGEPTLLGLDFFKRAVDIQKKYANGKRVTNALQTNGTLLDDEWAAFFAQNGFLIGVSIDGPADLHDTYRVDKRQRPTFDAVVRGIDVLKKHGADFNTLTVVSRGNQDHALRIYDFLKSIGSRYMQFIPLVERLPDMQARELGLDHALPPNGSPQAKSKVTPWSVSAPAYGKFLTDVFDQWVRRDVGIIFVQMFDMALSQIVDGHAGLCVFEETCGSSLAMEHNGDVYSCDHYVYPAYKLGNIAQTSLSDLASSGQQYRFGEAKRDSLTDYCQRCDVRFACNGDCPKHRFAVSPDGEYGLSYLCPSYKHFFTHTLPYVRAMADLLNAGRAPAEIMGILSADDARAAADQARRQAQATWKTARRNDPCPCGSGRKYKQCCLGKPAPTT